MNLHFLPYSSDFAAVEMRDNPKLASVPLAIGGNSRRGVLSTANYIAREYGVRSAMSNYHAKQLCPDLVIVPLHAVLLVTSR